MPARPERVDPPVDEDRPLGLGDGHAVDLAELAADDSEVTVERTKQSYSARIPLQRYGDPEEVARLMLFLASDESTYCTGGVYMVDGGRSAGSP